MKKKFIAVVILACTMFSNVACAKVNDEVADVNETGAVSSETTDIGEESSEATDIGEESNVSESSDTDNETEIEGPVENFYDLEKPEEPVIAMTEIESHAMYDSYSQQFGRFIDSQYDYDEDHNIVNKYESNINDEMVLCYSYYYENGNLVEEISYDKDTGAQGESYYYTYNEDGVISTISNYDPDGKLRSYRVFTYDAETHIASSPESESPFFQYTEWEYDDEYHLIRKTQYDGWDEVIFEDKYDDEHGNVSLERLYDEQGNEIVTYSVWGPNDPSNLCWTTEYNEHNDIISETEEDLNTGEITSVWTWEYEYDEDGRKISRIHYVDGRVYSKYEYQYQ